MNCISMREMLEAGAHFGHQVRRWNPKMKKFIFSSRNGIHIIDLQQTVILVKKTYDFVSKITSQGGKILFVGTKKQAQEVINREANRAEQYFVDNRWLGGMLTNFKTIKQSVDRMRSIEQMSSTGMLEKLPKKEVFRLSRQLHKFEKSLTGVKTMNKLPKAVFIIDPNLEKIAVDEAKKLKIPVIAIVDTNCNPDLIDFPIPANDDSIRSINLFVRIISDACIEGMTLHKTKNSQDLRSFDIKNVLDSAVKYSRDAIEQTLSIKKNNNSKFIETIPLFKDNNNIKDFEDEVY